MWKQRSVGLVGWWVGGRKGKKEGEWLGFEGNSGRGGTEVRGEGTYLADELLVQGLVVFGEGLFEEGEQDRDDEDCFEGFAEGDEEDGEGKDVGHFGFLFGVVISCFGGRNGWCSGGVADYQIWR